MNLNLNDFVKATRHIGWASVASVMLLGACNNGSKKPTESETAFHADDDIAMVVRSLADAINVGENLNPDDYNFTGVLTDGTGRPLYTDLQGLPGEWSIEVVDSTMATVRSTKIGDLATADLQSYLAGALQVDTADVYVARDFNGRAQSIYNIPGGYLVMTTQTDTTATGLTGERMSITLRR